MLNSRCNLYPANSRPYLQVVRSSPRGFTRLNVSRNAGIEPSDTSSSTSSRRTLKSLDNLLGSGSYDEVPAEGLDQLHSPDRIKQAATPLQPIQAIQKYTLVEEARAKPQVSYLLYYLTLIVYASYFGVDLLQGPEAADELASRIVNDHAAVADGDTLRLFTSAFVTYTPPQLITTLLALYSIAAELESIVGPPAFWAIYSLSTIIGSLADAAFSPWPVTHGPSAALAGTVGALLAHLVHNIEDLEGTAAKVFQRINPGKQLLQQQLDPDGATASRDGDGDDEVDGLKLKKVEIAEGLELTLLLPKKGRLWVDAVGLTAAAFTILDTIYSNSRQDASWQGMAVGFVVGACLGWGLGPVYELVDVTAEEAGGDSGRNKSAAAAAYVSGIQDATSTTIASSSSSSSGPLNTVGSISAGAEPENSHQQQQSRQLRLVDKKTALQRFNTALGLSSLVFGATAAWILTTGA